MHSIENDCVNCQNICRGSSCPNRNTSHYYCDRCSEEETLIQIGDKELCSDCAFEELYSFENAIKFIESNRQYKWDFYVDFITGSITSEVSDELIEICKARFTIKLEFSKCRCCLKPNEIEILIRDYIESEKSEFIEFMVLRI